MKECKLCGAVANKTGSHAIPWFLIRDAINKKNRKRRRNEISFEISNENFVNTYFGSEILPDDIQRVQNKELSDEEIDQLLNAKDPFTFDFILCSLCEDKFSILEDIISSEVIQKLRTKNTLNLQDTEEVSFQHTSLIRLFIYSIAWRCSISTFGKFKLESKHESTLHVLLNENLSINIEELKTNIDKNKARINKLPLIVVFFQTLGENTNSIFCSPSKSPYLIIANDFTFQLFFKESQLKSLNERAFGINDCISIKKASNICEEETFKIIIINDSKRLKVINNLYEFIADKILAKGASNFRFAFKKLFKKAAPQGLVNFFIREVIITDSDQTLKYSPEHFSNIAAKVINMYVKQHFR